MSAGDFHFRVSTPAGPSCECSPMSTTGTKKIQVMLGVAAAASALAMVVACGSDPKPEATAPTASAVASTTPPPETKASEPAAAADAGGGGKSDKQAECDALLDDANSTLDAERIAVDKVCKKDADCMPI